METTAGEKTRRMVEEWLENHLRPRLSPHYNTQNEDADREIVEESQSFTPRAFKEALSACPICHIPGDPAVTLRCLQKTHTKYFCYLCFEIIPFNSEKIAYHNLTKGHFSNPLLKLVPCPFATCPDSGCFNEEFYYMSGLRGHILKDHLPILDHIIASTENFDSENCGKLQLEGNSHSSGYMSATTMIDYRISSNANPPVLDSVGNSRTETKNKMPKLNATLNKSIKKSAPKKNSTNVNLGQEIRPLRPVDQNKGKNAPVAIQKSFVPQPFQCNLCRKKFPYRISLRSHKLTQACEFLNGKFCKHCEIAFDGFTIQTCIFHLKLHQKRKS